MVSEKYLTDRLKKISGRENDILLRACEGYVSTLFSMMLKGNDELEDEEKDTQNLDGVRVNFHHTIREILRMDNYHVDREKRKSVKAELNALLHGLQGSIGFPLPENPGYGEVKVDPDEIVSNHSEFVEEYGKKLCKHIIEEFSGKEFPESDER